MENAVRELLFQARRPRDLDTLVLAGVIGMALKEGRRPLIHGLSEARFQKLLNEFFLGVTLENGATPPGAGDEFLPFLQLLLDGRTEPSEPSAWLAFAVAAAAMRGESLWQEMGLPSPRHLSDFIQSRFAPLAARNAAGVDWKEFFRRELGDHAVC